MEINWSTKVVFKHRWSLIQVAVLESWHGLIRSGYWRCRLPYSNNRHKIPLHTTTYLITSLKPILFMQMQFQHTYYRVFMASLIHFLLLDCTSVVSHTQSYLEWLYRYCTVATLRGQCWHYPWQYYSISPSLDD